MQISIQEAYAEACRVIGEQIVERRFIASAQPVETVQGTNSAEPTEDTEHSISESDALPGTEK